MLWGVGVGGGGGADGVGVGAGALVGWCWGVAGLSGETSGNFRRCIAGQFQCK